MANETSRAPIASSLNLGGGLIEIGALTALIGSTTAASLVLGNKGAAGLLWGTMSIFGALSVIKACVAAATPDWLRETLGVRNKETDAAIGLSLDLDSKSLQKKSRVTGALGVACKVGVRGVVSENAHNTSDTETVEISRHDVYAFDQGTSGILELVPESEAVGEFLTYVLIQDAYSRMSSSRNSWTGLDGYFPLCYQASGISCSVAAWSHRAVPNWWMLLGVFPVRVHSPAASGPVS